MLDAMQRTCRVTASCSESLQSITQFMDQKIFEIIDTTIDAGHKKVDRQLYERTWMLRIREK